MKIHPDYLAYLGTPESGVPTQVRDALARKGIEPSRVLVMCEPKPFDPERPPAGPRPFGAPRHPGKLDGWRNTLAVPGVPPNAWWRCHTERWWAWWAYLPVEGDPVAVYAYEIGYTRGFEGQPSRPAPVEIGGSALVAFKAGCADGAWDRENGLARRTSFEPPARAPEGT